MKNVLNAVVKSFMNQVAPSVSPAVPVNAPSIGDILKEASRARNQKEADDDYEFLLKWFDEEFAKFLLTWRLYTDRDYYSIEIEGEDIFHPCSQDKFNKKVRSIIAPYGFTTFGLHYSSGISLFDPSYRNRYSIELRWYP